jgi:hypothetical protein
MMSLGKASKHESGGGVNLRVICKIEHLDINPMITWMLSFSMN